MHRRELLKNGAAALTVAATKPLFAWQGANNRVRMAVIGMGGRSGRVFDSLTRYDDVQFTMGCEVAQNKQQNFQSANRPLAQKLDVVGDYRRVLDRNDIDAVLIGTPDFSHARITADALAAGQARLRREADCEQHRAHQHDARRLQQVSESRRAGRHAAAELGSLHRSEVEDGVARPRHPRPHPARRRLFAEQAGRR